MWSSLSSLQPQQPLLMGVLNVTPDSFSDGGKFENLDAAVSQARSLFEAGAAIIDIGGESTRPGAERVPVAQEIDRVVPVIEAIRAADWASGSAAPRISIDTMNHQTALAAIAAGAQIVNDVSGGLADPEMLDAIAPTDATYVLGHWRGHSALMDSLNHYDDIAADVAAELADRLVLAAGAGVLRERIVLDPGLGFAKDASQNWQLIAGLARIQQLGLPVLIGASRKRFLAAALDGTDSASVQNDRRDAATAVLTGMLAGSGVWGFRVHNVAANRDALRVAGALQSASQVAAE